MAYSADDRVRALVALRDCGTYSGAERATGISRETIRGWATSGALPGARRKSPVRLTYEEKVAAVRRLCLGERAGALASEAGVSASAVSGWRATLRREGAPALMGDREVAAADELAARNRELELRVAVLEAKLEMLKKGPGADASALTGRGRVALADSLRGRFPLPDLLAEVGLARRGPEPAARRRGARPARLLGGCARRAARDRHH